MTRYIVTKLLDAIPTLLLVITLVFIAMRVLPGDPAYVALGDFATPDQIEAFREEQGLNDPLWQQYWEFLVGVLTLDFGTSLTTGTPVLEVIGFNLPYTLELAAFALILGPVVGITLGVFAATNRNRGPDSAVRVYSLLGYAVPDFFIGAVLLIVFGLSLGWFPVIGGGGDDVLTRLHYVFLPAITLAAIQTAFIARLTRASLLETLSKEYVRTARAKGAPESKVIYGHGLRNAMLPLVTGLGLSILSALSGSVAVEMVFNRPGVGKMLIDAITERDYAVVQGGIIIIALFVVLVNLIMDLVYTVVDPRVRV